MYRIMAITLAFQANDDGSIPFARSIVTNFTGSLYASFFIASKKIKRGGVCIKCLKTPVIKVCGGLGFRVF